MARRPSDRSSSDATLNRPFFLPLLDPDVPMRPMARLLLVAGLNATRPELSGLATDLLIAAVDDGRLDGTTLGSTLTELARIQVDGSLELPAWQRTTESPPQIPIVKLNRWAKALGEASRASPLHARVIASAVSYLFRGDPFQTQRTANLQPLLILLKELLIETGQALADPDARASLMRLETSGKTGKLARAILDIQAIPDHPSRLAAARFALNRRIERSERWASWSRDRKAVET